jgi:hypothetical protein
MPERGLFETRCLQGITIAIGPNGIQDVRDVGG